MVQNLGTSQTTPVFCVQCSSSRFLCGFLWDDRTSVCAGKRVAASSAFVAVHNEFDSAAISAAVVLLKFQQPVNCVVPPPAILWLSLLLLLLLLLLKPHQHSQIGVWLLFLIIPPAPAAGEGSNCLLISFVYMHSYIIEQPRRHCRRLPLHTHVRAKQFLSCSDARARPPTERASTTQTRPNADS